MIGMRDCNNTIVHSHRYYVINNKKRIKSESGGILQKYSII